LNRFVLDASVALSWFVDVPVDTYAGEVRDRIKRGMRGIVPQLWQLEFANGLLVAERRKLLDAVTADGAIIDVERLKISHVAVETEPPLMGELLKIARLCQLTAYDAAYLALALQEKVPLATLDKRLAAGAAKAGVALLK
jgi:predicted nucleic acid-binding protein